MFSELAYNFAIWLTLMFQRLDTDRNALCKMANSLNKLSLISYFSLDLGLNE